MAAIRVAEPSTANKHVWERGMNAVIKLMWLMTHLNIGATLALIAWMVCSNPVGAAHDGSSALAAPTPVQAAISAQKELP
jgi:hypothetical protein